MDYLINRPGNYSDFTTQHYSEFMRNLVEIWQNEKLSLSLLPYQENIINDVIELIEKKESELKVKKYEKNVRNYIEIDIQRIKFIVKDYLRIRLMKIEKYLFFLLKNNKIDILSQNEIKFAAELMDVKAAYFIQGLKKMNSLANNFYSFSDKNKSRVAKMGAISDAMITKPAESEFVVVQNISNKTIDLNIKELINDYQGEFISIYSGDKCLVPYKLIEPYLMKKQVKII